MEEKVEIFENERIDDLELNGLKIIQNKERFCFGIDSVLIANFAKDLKKDSKVLDLGTGTGIIPTILCGKSKVKKVVGIEIQKEVCEMANRSIEMNKLSDKFDIICDSILNLNNYFKKQEFDVVISNPPYKKINTGIVNDNDFKMISRHEITASLEDFIRSGSDMLKDKGEFYMVHHPERLVDIFYYMRKYKVEPKNVRFVVSRLGEMPKLVLIKAVKNGKPFLKVEKDLNIYKEKDIYSDEIIKMYKGDK